MSSEIRASTFSVRGGSEARPASDGARRTAAAADGHLRNRPLRVLHVIPAVAAAYGGPSLVIRDMAAALSRRDGLRVEVASTDAGLSAAECAAAGEAFPVPLRLFRRTASERWKYSRRLGDWLSERAADFDLLHVHGVWSYATFAACRAAARAGVPVVLRPCGMLSEYSRRRSPRLKAAYWRLVERRNLESVRAFHATSAAEVGEVRRAGLAADAWVIPNGVDPEAWTRAPDPGRLAAACGSDAAGKAVVLFLSRLHPKKGVTDLLLPAFRRLGPNALLAVAGGPDGHSPRYAAEVRREAGRRDLRGRVALLGPVTPAARWGLLDGASLLVLPSRSENFGVVVAEAMARGVPVLVTEGVQAAEHVRAAGAGCVVPPEVGPLADAMGRLLGAANLRRSMGEAGREYARRAFAWDAIAERIDQFYRAALIPPADVESEYAG